MKCSDQDIRRIAAESLVDVRTVKKFVEGGAVRPTNVHRIREAAKKLKVKLGGS